MSKITDAIENLEIADFNNRKIVLSTKEGTPMRIHFPRLYMPFGISGFTPEVGPTKYNVDLALKGYDEDGSYINKFYTSIRAIENKIIDAVVEQSEKIFQKKMTKEELVPMFNSNVKESPDREPKFRVKVDTITMVSSRLLYMTQTKTQSRLKFQMVSMQEIRVTLLLNSIVCIS